MHGGTDVTKVSRVDNNFYVMICSGDALENRDRLTLQPNIDAGQA
jgi:hypothetical protein